MLYSKKTYTERDHKLGRTWRDMPKSIKTGRFSWDKTKFRRAISLCSTPWWWMCDKELAITNANNTNRSVESSSNKAKTETLGVLLFNLPCILTRRAFVMRIDISRLVRWEIFSDLHPNGWTLIRVLRTKLWASNEYGDALQSNVLCWMCDFEA